MYVFYVICVICDMCGRVMFDVIVICDMTVDVCCVSEFLDSVLCNFWFCARIYEILTL